MAEKKETKRSIDWVRIVINAAIVIPLAGMSFIRIFSRYHTGHYLLRWIGFTVILFLIILDVYLIYRSDSFYNR